MVCFVKALNTSTKFVYYTHEEKKKELYLIWIEEKITKRTNKNIRDVINFKYVALFANIIIFSLYVIYNLVWAWVWSLCMLLRRCHLNFKGLRYICCGWRVTLFNLNNIHILFYTFYLGCYQFHNSYSLQSRTHKCDMSIKLIYTPHRERERYTQTHTKILYRHKNVITLCVCEWLAGAAPPWTVYARYVCAYALVFVYTSI